MSGHVPGARLVDCIGRQVVSATPAPFGARSEPSETGDGHLTNPSSAPADAVASGQQSETPSRFVAAQGSPGPDSAGPAISGQPGSFDYQAAAPAAKKRSRTPLAAAVSIVVVILLIVGAVVVFGNSTSASAKVINAVTSTLNDGTAHVTLNLSGSAQGTNVTGTDPETSTSPTTLSNCR